MLSAIRYAIDDIFLFGVYFMDKQEFNGVIFSPDERGYYRCHNLYMHRYVWEYYNTKIPKGYDVHHKDLNRGNNDISNLQLLSHQEHITLHKRLRKLGSAMHNLICTNCGKMYIGETNGGNTFCCNACKSAYRRRSGKNNIERICVCCGKTFITDKYKHSKTCSRSCANRQRAIDKKR